MAKSASQTPLMRQYLEWKNRYADAVLLFRLGDFYEMFYEDAVKVSAALDLTLTTRDKNKKDPVPMCGIPHHTKDSYVSRLVEKGYKVAVCEQMEEPSSGKGIVRREVTRVITPGVILDLEHLDARAANYLAAVWVGEMPERISEEEGGDPDRGATEAASTRAYGLALVDASTGEFRITCVEGVEALLDELARSRPRQLLFPEGQGAALENRLSEPKPLTEEVPTERFFLEGHKGLERVASGSGETVDNLSFIPQDAVPAAAAVLLYLEETLLHQDLPPLRVLPYQRSDFMVLDEATLANLEVFETLMEGRKEGSLLGVMDETVTPMGGRLLRAAMAFPLQDFQQIERRQDAVSQFLEAPAGREAVRKILKEIHDLERLGRRVGHGVASPKDLAALRRSLERMPTLAAALQECRPLTEAMASARDLSLLDISGDLLMDVAERIAAALVDDPPATLKDGGVIRRGYHAELDELVDASRGGRDRILAIEERERKRTGISSLKVKFNKVFGYYIEVTKANLSDVPDDYTRKQTLVNSERFVTAELAEHEAFVLEAEEKRGAMEEQLFQELRGALAPHAARIAKLAGRVAMVDLLSSFAQTAATRGYVRPTVDEGQALEIKEGRHPVVERYQEAGAFVPNDTTLSPEDQNLLIITGPNMAGKSTIIRQVAIIALLAHTGSFVPAQAASLGLVDRIFTRVGASDNLARGESTFMVEMKETSNILRYATQNSLVILDEIGRGTSTFDGMSLAWAVAEYLHDRVGARSLFATHYHELCELSRVKSRVKNFAVMVREWRDEIVFLHKLAPGGVNRSYGIQVARLAGLPDPVVRRALEILERLEQGEALNVTGEKHRQLDLFSSEYSTLGAASRRAGGGEANTSATIHDEEDPKVGVSAGTKTALERLRRLDPDELSPKKALEILYEIQGLLDD